jgi:hypothetical protein
VRPENSDDFYCDDDDDDNDNNNNNKNSTLPVCIAVTFYYLRSKV